MLHIVLISKNQSLIESRVQSLSKKYSVSTLSDISDIHDLTQTPSLLIIDTDLLDSESVSLASLSKYRLLLIGHDWSSEKQVNALLSGASGYCLNSINTPLFYKAVESVLKGDIWIQRNLIPQVINILVKSHALKLEKTAPQSTSNLELLSNRELDVAKMVRNGDSNKDIGAVLNISERTVKAHLTSIFKKLNIPDRLHLAMLLKENGY